MTENAENLILEQLRILHNDIKAFRSRAEEDMEIVKHRLSSLEQSVAILHVDMAAVHARLDSQDKRMKHVEDRLELYDEKTS